MDRIELERAYKIQDEKEIIAQATENEFKKVEEIQETDTYFTDAELKMIKERICLRIRRTDKGKMELTFKPRSSEKTKQYGKKEVNVAIQQEEFEDIKFIIEQLGYMVYVEFTKNRTIFSKREKEIEYNIMLDELEGIGKFVEFEIITDGKIQDEMRNEKLQEYLNLFSASKLEKKKGPYREIAKEYQDKMNKKY